MKQCSILLFFCLFIPALRSQTFPYTLTVDQAAYAPLENAIALTDGVWDDPDLQTPVGFNFQMFGQTIPSLYWYGELTANLVAGAPTAGATPFLVAYGADLIDRGYESGTSMSPIRYKTEGAPGSRIFKMEWANAGFYEDATGEAFINFQVWLYEGSNNVELRFGPTQTNGQQVFTDFSGPLIGFMDQFSLQDGTFDNLFYLTGSPEHPIIQTVDLNNADTLFNTLSDTPTDGTVYRFSTGIVGTENPTAVAQQARVFPTLAKDAVSIELADELLADNTEVRYRVVDQWGKNLRTGQVTDVLTRVDMSTLPAGAYYVNLFSPDQVVATVKVWKE
ncbi:MAG: T9SS type A sorting domain-containing protein [Bacteroidetes bacterium]|nr:T9SS type A sorting domain-containing protein [Bacteroidota bacterium]